MSNFAQPEYSVSAQMSDIPMSVQSSDARRSIPASSQLVQVTSQSGPQYANGLLLWNVAPARNSFIKNGSAYVKFTLQVTNNAAAAAIACSGAQLSTSWGSLIQRMTIMANSNVIEQIQYYNTYEQVIYEHATTTGFYQNDLKALAGATATTSAVQGTYGTAVTVVVPLLSGVFNSVEHLDFPLGMLPGGLQIQLDLSSDSQGISSAGNANCSFQISNAYFGYEKVTVSEEYMNALKGELAAQGQLYQMPFVSSLNMAVNTLATTDVVFGLGLTSLKSCLVTNVPSVSFAPRLQASNTLTVMRIYCDNELINQFQVSDDVTAYLVLQSALGNLSSVTSNSAASDFTIATYDTKYFATGVSTNKFEERGLTLSGRHCAQLQVHLEMSAVPGGGSTTFIMSLFDGILAISPLSGEASIIR